MLPLGVVERDRYWAERYCAPDWSKGIHIGDFAADETSNLEAATEAADTAMLRTIFETCSLYRLTTGLRVLEIGFGNGGLAAQLVTRAPKIQYHGYEVGEAAVEAARKEVQRWQLVRGCLSSESSAEFRLGGAHAAWEEHQTQTGEDGFDVILIREVYYLLSSNERANIIELAKKNLRRGGIFIFSDLFVASSNVPEAVSRELYTRHHSQGPVLRIEQGTFEHVKNWFLAEFGSTLRVVKVHIDDSSIHKTYSAALNLVEGSASATNLEAYRNLRDLSSSRDGKAPVLIYVNAIMFNDDDGLETALGNGDFRFTARRDYHNALRSGCNYGIKTGAWNLIVGRSGGGKTTILRALQGDLKRYLKDGIEPLRGYRSFILAQDMDIFDSFSPQENVQAFGGERFHIERLLRRLGLSEKFMGRRDSFLVSGGERQRVALAQSMIAKPEVLLLDEPLKGLDQARRLVLFDLLKEEIAQYASTTMTVACTDHAFEIIEREFDYVFEVMYGRQVLVSRHFVREVGIK